MRTLFSKVLRKARKEAGFKTAYQFFHNSGGDKYFRTTYRMYLHMEQGKFLPPLKDLLPYMYALRILPMTYSALEFTTAWLKSSHGEEAFDALLAPLFRANAQPSVSSPLHKAVETLLAEKKFHINHEQLSVIVKNKNTALCWTALSHDEAAWQPKALAAQLQIPPAATRAALRDLEKVKLIKLLKTGAYQCPMAGAMIEYPTAHSSIAELSKKLNALRDEMIESGRLMFRRRGIIRASLANLANCFPLLSLNLSTAQTYATIKKEKDSALFGVECRVVRIRQF
ncbi:MAG: hypothetical protein AB7V08_13405 [Elusimicrobiales bacterium]